MRQHWGIDRHFVRVVLRPAFGLLAILSLTGLLWLMPGPPSWSDWNPLRNTEWYREWSPEHRTELASGLLTGAMIAGAVLLAERSYERAQQQREKSQADTLVGHAADLADPLLLDAAEEVYLTHEQWILALERLLRDNGLSELAGIRTTFLTAWLGTASGFKKDAETLSQDDLPALSVLIEAAAQVHMRMEQARFAATYLGQHATDEESVVLQILDTGLSSRSRTPSVEVANGVVGGLLQAIATQDPAAATCLVALSRHLSKAAVAPLGKRGADAVAAVATRLANRPRELPAALELLYGEEASAILEEGLTNTTRLVDAELRRQERWLMVGAVILGQKPASASPENHEP